MGRLDGKVAVVTGTSSGIGLATAWLFAREGAKVVMGARREERGVKTEKEMRDAGLEAIYVKTDITLPADCTNLIEKAVAKYGRLDILANIAGISGGANGKLHELDLELRDRLFRTNLFGIIDLCRAAIPHMLAQGKGSIVNVSSVAALIACKGDCFYSAVKGAVNALTVTMAIDYGMDGIRVNCVCPGLTRSEMTTDLMNGGSGNYERIFATIPLGRIAEPEETAQGILFLASDEASFCNGVILQIDGGEIYS